MYEYFVYFEAEFKDKIIKGHLGMSFQKKMNANELLSVAQNKAIQKANEMADVIELKDFIDIVIVNLNKL